MQKKYLIIALLFHLLAAWFSIGRYHADEQFQLVEYVGLKTGVNTADKMPWEFHEKMRPTIQVAFAFAVIKSFPFVSNPFTQTFLLRLFSALLGLFALTKLLKAFKKNFSDTEYKLLSILSCCYCFIPYFHARFSSENISASLFILGLTSVLNAKHLRNYFYAGLFFGLAYAVRMQTLFMIFGLGLWMLIINKDKINVVFVLALGFVISVFAGVVSDRWFYGEWVNTTWNYIYQNIILHRSAEYGVEPFWFYFEKIFLDAIPPFSIIIICSFLILFVFKRKHVLTWVFVPFILIHFFTTHKELRFLFPIINFIPLVFIIALKDVRENEFWLTFKNKLISYKLFYIPSVFLTINGLLLVFLCLKPADDFAPILKFLYNNYGEHETRMYYTSFNPYDELVTLGYYKSNNVIPEKIDTLSLDLQISSGERSLIITEEKADVEFLQKRGYTLNCVYSSIPAFMYYLNFNNWIERAGNQKIYEVIPSLGRDKEY